MIKSQTHCKPTFVCLSQRNLCSLHSPHDNTKLIPKLCVLHRRHAVHEHLLMVRRFRINHVGCVKFPTLLSPFGLLQTLQLPRTSTSGVFVAGFPVKPHKLLAADKHNLFAMSPLFCGTQLSLSFCYISKLRKTTRGEVCL